MSEDDFLSRWSRRKRSVAEEESTPADPAPLTTSEPEEPQTQEEEDALLSQLNLPAPESLKPGDDFSAFMADGVPQFLRKRALRILWRSNPVLANLDGLNDYAEDFRSPELTQKVLATAYQVGRGIVSQVTETETAASENPPPDEVETPVSEDAEVAEISPENQAPVNTVVHSEEPEQAVRPRRMRFTSQS